MRRVRWIAWNVLTALSFLLCLATLALWVRSYWVRDTVGFGWAGGNCHVAQSILGRLHVLTTLGGGYVGGTTYEADRLSPQAIWQRRHVQLPPRRVDPMAAGLRLADLQPHPHGDGAHLHRLLPPDRRAVLVPCRRARAGALAWAAGLRRRVGLLDLMIIVAAVALVLALPAFLAASMNQTSAAPG